MKERFILSLGNQDIKWAAGTVEELGDSEEQDIFIP